LVNVDLDMTANTVNSAAMIHYIAPVNRLNTQLGVLWLLYHSNNNLSTPAGDIRISNQFLITSAFYFAQPRQPYYQVSVTITLGRKV